MTNSADPDLFIKTGHDVFSMRRVKLKCMSKKMHFLRGNSAVSSSFHEEEV